MELNLANMRVCFKFPEYTEEEKAEMARQAAEEDEYQRRREFGERLMKAHIPERYREARLAECLKEVRDYAAEVIGGSDGWLILRGKNGRGKTYQACATLHCVAHELRCEFTTMQEILESCKDTFGRPESATSVVSRYRSIPFLVIDDFGKEQATEWSLPVIFEIIDGRYRRRKPTLFTTNMNSTQLLDHLACKGDRTMADSVLSRLLEAECIEVKGEDRRVSKMAGIHG